MSQPIYVSKSLTGASANAIALSQSPGAAGNLTINGGSASGGVATLDSNRQVRFTFAADETGKTFVVYGTQDANGSTTTIQETVLGTASTADTTQSFKTVTRISIDAASTGALTVGTNTVGATSWLIQNWDIAPFQLAIAVLVTGTVNYTIQHTYEDPSGQFPNPAPATDGYVNPNAPTPGQITKFPTSFNHDVLYDQSITNQGSYLSPVAAVRLQINSGTGTAQLILLQAGIAGN